MPAPGGYSRFTRRQLISGWLVSAAALGLAACARRAPDAVSPTLAAGPTAVPAQPATAVAQQVQALTPAPTSAQNAQVQRGGMLTTAVQNDWITFDSIFNSANVAPHLMIYDPLFFFQPDDQGAWRVTPGLVEKWDFSDTAAMFHLRKGVTFHDGSDWNADVLKWNFERMANDPKSIAKAVITGVDLSNPVTVIDPYTAKINLSQPAPSLAEQLSAANNAYTWPISRTAFEKLGPDEYARHPVGTGPFKFVEWRPSDRVILQRNDNYWMTGADGKALPYLDGITYRLIIDDTVRAVELKSHNIDVTDLISPKDMPSIQADPSLTLIQGKWAGNSRRLIFHAQGGPFSNNLKLRQAVLYSIDRETLSATLGQGQGDASKYLLLPGALGYDEKQPYYWYDLDKAKSLMIDAGYPNGIDVHFIIIAREVDQAQAQVLTQMWEKIGVRASIEAVERAALNQRILAGGADYEVTSGQYGNYAGDADLQLRTYLHSKGSFNKAHMKSYEMDALLDKASGTYDPAARVALYHDAQTLDFNLGYYGYLWTQWWTWAMTKRVVGFPKQMGQYWDLRTVSLAA